MNIERMSLNLSTTLPKKLTEMQIICSRVDGIKVQFCEAITRYRTRISENGLRGRIEIFLWKTFCAKRWHPSFKKMRRCQVVFLRSLTLRPRHSLIRTPWNLQCAIQVFDTISRLSWICHIIDLRSGQFRGLPIISHCQWGKIKYLEYLSDLFKSLRMMMYKAKDDIPGAILH